MKEKEKVARYQIVTGAVREKWKMVAIQKKKKEGRDRNDECPKRHFKGRTTMGARVFGVWII